MSSLIVLFLTITLFTIYVDSSSNISTESSTITTYLLVGLGDGALITFELFQDSSLSSGVIDIRNRRKVVLGTHPISLTMFHNMGISCVFASCDRPTVISTRNKKIVFSVVNIPEVTGMVPFHSECFPGCLAFSSEGSLTIGNLDEIQKLHIQTIPLNESPSRIAYSPQCSLYAGE